VLVSKKEKSRQLIKSKCEEFDYTGISEIPKVIRLIKKRELIEKQINTFSNYLRSKHSPLVMDKETMIESESLFGDVGFFESKMTGYLNE
jgi:hypothetical protein